MPFQIRFNAATFRAQPGNGYGDSLYSYLSKAPPHANLPPESHYARIGYTPFVEPDLPKGGDTSQNPDAEKVTAALIEDIRKTPNLPRGRPDIALAEVIARDNAEKAWYKDLTHKQRMFVCALFANAFDVGAAAREVIPSLSVQNARTKGKYWYELPKVRNAIEAIFNYYQESTKVRWEDMIAELKTIAFANIMDFYVIDKDGDPELAMPQAKDGVYSASFGAIAEINIEHTKFGQKSRIKMHDKMGAIDRLIKLLQPAAGVGSEGGGTVIQNIIINPVPAGQFLPAPQINQAPIIDVTPNRPQNPILKVVPK